MQEIPRGEKKPENHLTTERVKSGVFEKIQRLSQEEKERQAEDDNVYKTAERLDQDFFVQIASYGDSLTEKIEKMDTAEALRSGKEIIKERKKVEEGTATQVSRRVYEGDPPVIAFVKPANGETTLYYDPQRKAVLFVEQVWSEEHQRFDKKEGVFAQEGASEDDDKYIAHYRELKEQIASIKRDVAQYYEIDPSEVPLDENEFLSRMGLEIGSGALREYAFSRMNELLNFGVVPLTGLRRESVSETSPQQRTRLCSAQQGFLPSEPMDDKLYKEVLRQGSEHPGAKSFMRIAILDYLGVMIDRHPDNIRWNGEQFMAIDNAPSFCLSGKEGKPLDAYRSVALEVIQAHPEWKLDDEALDHLRKLYDSTLAYLKLREEAKSIRETPGTYTEGEAQAMKATSGKEIKYLTSLLRLTYGNEKIAEKEGLTFFRKIEYILKNGRPPAMKLGNEGGMLQPMAEEHLAAKKAEQQAQAA